MIGAARVASVGPGLLGEVREVNQRLSDNMEHRIVHRLGGRS
jgi:hypothetical protein